MKLSKKLLKDPLGNHCVSSKKSLNAGSLEELSLKKKKKKMAVPLIRTVPGGGKKAGFHKVSPIQAHLDMAHMSAKPEGTCNRASL